MDKVVCSFCFHGFEYPGVIEIAGSKEGAKICNRCVEVYHKIINENIEARRKNELATY